MKILILQDDFPPFGKGGAASVAYELARGYKAAGHDVLVISAAEEKTHEGTARYGGITIHRIFSSYPERWRAYRSLYDPSTVGRVKRILHSFNPDIVHVHNTHYHLSYHVLRVAKKSGAHVILTAHDMMLFHYGKLFPVPRYVNKEDACESDRKYRVSFIEQIKDFKWRYNPLRNIVIRFYLRYVDRVCAVSHAQKSVLEANGIKNVEVVHNAISIEEWDKPAQEVLGAFLEKHDLKNKKVVLFVGSPSAAKGWHQLMEAMLSLEEAVPNATVIVAGRKQKVQVPHGVDVQFTGWLSGDDLSTAYHASDVVVSPSICFETFGMVALEAMAMRRPVVATCLGGTKEVTRDGKTGYVCNPYNTKQLAEAIKDILVFPDKAKQFGEQGYARAKEYFSLERQVKEYISLHKK